MISNYLASILFYFRVKVPHNKNFIHIIEFKEPLLMNTWTGFQAIYAAMKVEIKSAKVLALSLNIKASKN